jgi:hypothetical protein
MIKNKNLDVNNKRHMSMYRKCDPSVYSESSNEESSGDEGLRSRQPTIAFGAKKVDEKDGKPEVQMNLLDQQITFDNMQKFKKSQ